jgi:hypothetical protein
MEQENKPIETQVVAQEQNNPVLENQQQENPQERNWKLFREQREKERREKLEAERLAAQKAKEAEALKAALEAVVNKPSSQTYQEEISDEDKLKKTVAEILAKERQKEEEERKLREQQQLPQRIKENYPDFESVCTNENMDYLQYHYPEVASAFKYAPDNYETWSSVYKAIKRFVPNVDGKKEQAKAQNNLTKPQSIAKPGATPTGDSAPQFLDEKRRAENWKRMQKTMKGL